MRFAYCALRAAAFTRSEYEKWKTVIIEGKIKPE